MKSISVRCDNVDVVAWETGEVLAPGADMARIAAVLDWAPLAGIELVEVKEEPEKARAEREAIEAEWKAGEPARIAAAAAEEQTRQAEKSAWTSLHGAVAATAKCDNCGGTATGAQWSKRFLCDECLSGVP